MPHADYRALAVARTIEIAPAASQYRTAPRPANTNGATQFRLASVSSAYKASARSAHVAVESRPSTFSVCAVNRSFAPRALRRGVR
ncbi:unnamed protein product [Peniophora sp. CBMAI 1063]|nr:unnamed protein product [Peniophora sp. CBMAI 1063]